MMYSIPVGAIEELRATLTDFAQRKGESRIKVQILAIKGPKKRPIRVEGNNVAKTTCPECGTQFEVS